MYSKITVIQSTQQSKPDFQAACTCACRVVRTQAAAKSSRDKTLANAFTTLQVHYEFNYELVFSDCIFRNLLLLPNFLGIHIHSVI